jgi:hypothetical protein
MTRHVCRMTPNCHVYLALMKSSAGYVRIVNEEALQVN